ncbi:MAG: hypothetical protein D3909_19735 [Candidatus Electrothrix sp. ATG1]|nr:hypothetical protein [Candidatus Electrothrix sp. ATG1]
MSFSASLSSPSNLFSQNGSHMPHPPYIIRPGVPEEVFTDRQEFLDFSQNLSDVLPWGCGNCRITFLNEIDKSRLS